MTVYAITDTKKGRTGIAPTYLQTTPTTLHVGTSAFYPRPKSEVVLLLTPQHTKNEETIFYLGYVYGAYQVNHCLWNTKI